MSRKFVPEDPYTRVSFAARGVTDLVVVEASGLVLPETEDREVMTWNEETQKYEPETQAVPINEDLFAALEAHEHVKEVGAGFTPPTPPTTPTPPTPPTSDDSKE